MKYLLLILLLACQQDEIQIKSIKKTPIDDMYKEVEGDRIRIAKDSDKKVEKQCKQDSDCAAGQKCVDKTCTKAAAKDQPVKLNADMERHSDFFLINRSTTHWR